LCDVHAIEANVGGQVIGYGVRENARRGVRSARLVECSVEKRKRVLNDLSSAERDQEHESGCNRHFRERFSSLIFFLVFFVNAFA
tara:strand:- start:329 stop:583 length:255 start_codon:yes stop_codon:yes gene_type:complete